MDTSIFLAQAIGLYFVIAGIAMLVRPRAVHGLIKTLAGNRDVIFATGFIALLIGVPLVLVHNVWDGTWRVIITLLVWLTLIKGVARLFVPNQVVDFAAWIAKRPMLLRAAIWIMVIIGLYLVYIGFGIASPA